MYEDRILPSLCSIGDRGFHYCWKPSFKPFHKLTPVVLQDLLVFDISGEIMKCTQFLITSVHRLSLWLDQSYPIHVNDIHMVMVFSMEGKDVSIAF